MTTLPRAARRSLLVSIALLALSPAARAQTTQADPATKSRIRLGPLWINPALNVKNFGIDSNVFNDPNDPKRDFTATITPMTDIFVRAPMLRADLRVLSDLVYYRRYQSERSSNAQYSGVFTLVTTRVSPYLGVDYFNTRERPGFEVDARAHHTVARYRLGSDVRLGTRGLASVELGRTRTSFSTDTAFRGVSLSDQLNRDENIGRLTVKEALTPLTRVVIGVDVQRDRFDADRTRESNSYRITGGFEFDPIALISGGATIGYRKIRFRAADVPDTSGLVTSVNVGYALSASTRLGLVLARDAQYSYDPQHPYYVQTGGTLTLNQRVYGAWDVQMTGGRQTLAYRDRTDVPNLFPGDDHVSQYGAGIGYRLGPDSRLAFTVMHNRRRSPDPARRYDGNQFGASITYGT